MPINSALVPETITPAGIPAFSNNPLKEMAWSLFNANMIVCPYLSKLARYLFTINLLRSLLFAISFAISSGKLSKYSMFLISFNPMLFPTFISVSQASNKGLDNISFFIKSFKSILKTIPSVKILANNPCSLSAVLKGVAVNPSNLTLSTLL